MYTSTEQTPDIYKWANSEWHHFDPLGTAGVITNGTASVISNNLYDLFGVLRYEQGSAQTPWRWKRNRVSDEGLLQVRSNSVVLPGVNVTVRMACAAPVVDIDWDCVKDCFNATLIGAIAGCVGAAGPRCGPCILLTVGTCILTPPSCGAMYSLCSLFCSGSVMNCVWGAIVSGAAAFLKCYLDCVQKKRSTYILVPIPTPVGSMSMR